MGAPDVLHDNSSPELGGSVRIVDPEGQDYHLDIDTGELLNSNIIDENPCSENAESHAEHYDRDDDPNMKLSNDAKMQKLWDQADAKKVEHESVTSGINDSFIQICKKLKLGAQHHHLYRQWALKNIKSPEGSNLIAEEVPDGRCKVKPGITFPKPTGLEWRQTIKQSETKSKHDIDHEMVDMAVKAVIQELNDQKVTTRKTGIVNFAKASRRCYGRKRGRGDNNAYAAKKKRRIKAIAGDRETAPNKTRACLKSIRGFEWCNSIDEEFDDLTAMGVVKNGYTIDEIRAMRITSPILPIILIHDYKYAKVGLINRLKTRAALQGDKWHTKKEVHYWETFTATPREDTSRILAALLVHKNLKRRCSDIEKAYCWADLPKEQWLACKYPDGLQRCNEAGEELYCIVVKNLYGGPASGRNWGILRDFTLLSIFNDKEKRAEMEFWMKKEKGQVQ